MLKKTHLAALLSTILLTACQSIPTTTSPANTPINTSSSAQAFVYDTTLDNGLRVLIKQDKRAP
ncbi:MAG: hypothetical protein Q4C68_07505, partial [Moraxella sp.]|nr:hypothetical protein [Moraxella sp.]